MKVVLLVNHRALREGVRQALTDAGHGVEAFSTAADAYDVLQKRHADCIAMDWQVFPGLGCADPSIQILAGMIPDMGRSENIGYWQVAVRLLEALRTPSSMNRSTPIVLTRPPVDQYYGEDFSFSMSTVERDLRDKQPVVMVSEPKIEAISTAVLSQRLE